MNPSRRLYDALNAGPVYAFLLSPDTYAALLTEVDRDVPGTKDKGIHTYGVGGQSKARIVVADVPDIEVVVTREAFLNHPLINNED